jgi:exodeoxyribonuclease VII large subunit
MSLSKTYQLSDLLSDLQMVILSSFDQVYWVIAELANISGSPRGHMYFELVEKNEQQIVAKARANLWSYRRPQIITAFEETTRQTLKPGMKVLLQLKVDFHQVYGLSFQVLDIDPSYSLGELERQKQETIKKLREEGLLDFNKQFVLPQVLQNLAIISSETAAGYQDFMDQLENNTLKYKFRTKIFPALMQGDKAPGSIALALDKLEQSKEEFDVIVLIRGGGSNLDLACFDSYELNARLAQSFLPVFSGIGHERDHSVVDMVVHTRLKTPTAVAESIVQHNEKFEKTISELFNNILKFANDILLANKEKMKEYGYLISQSSQNLIFGEKNFLKEFGHILNNMSSKSINSSRKQLTNRTNELKMITQEIYLKKDFHLKGQINALSDKSLQLLTKETDKLQLNNKLRTSSLSLLEKSVSQMQYMDHVVKISHPQAILKKGFSISKINGKAIRNIDDSLENQILETQLFKGVIKSRILKENKNGKKTDL